MKVKIILQLIAVFAITVVLAAGSCGRKSESTIDIKGVATVHDPVISPSGNYQLKVTEETIKGVRHNKFAIFKVSNGNTDSSAIFTSNDAYRTRDTLYFIWDDQDRVWVYSGDVGVFFWERVSDDNWQKRTYADNMSVPVPLLLKQLEPRYFK